MLILQRLVKDVVVDQDMIVFRKKVIGKHIHDLFIQRHNKNINKSSMHKNIKIQQKPKFPSFS
jgi:hypothetical protein